jgi:transglutaminase superfamily protein
MYGVDFIQTSDLLPGTPGITQTLQAMASLVRRDSQDMQLRDKALEICSHCDGHDFEDEIHSLFRYCRDGITYRRDPVQQERVQDAKRTIYVFGTGDCDDKVVCLATLLGCLGHRSRFKVLGRKRDKYTHVYLETYCKGKWIPLDPTPEEAPAGWEGQGYTAVYDIFPDDDAESDKTGLIALSLLFFWWVSRR